MNNRRRNTYTLFLFSTLFCLTYFIQIATASNNTIEKSQNTLRIISNKIDTLRHSLLSDKKNKHHVETDLRETELSINQIGNRLHTLDQKIHRVQTTLDDLQTRQNAQHEKLSQQATLLAKQIRQAYILGRHPFVKMILNQEDPANITRTLYYYRTINESRAKVIKAMNQTLNSIRQNTLEIIAQKQQLLSIQKQRQEQRQTLVIHENRQSRLLTQLKQIMHRKGQKLIHLTRDKTKLEALIRHLQAKTNHLAKSGLKFTKMRGKLPWPVAGPLAIRFGSHPDNSPIQTTGVLIQSPLGQAVKAVYPGRVVFANWLRGYGLLLIIEHQSGYMTLYGHNNSLYKQVGDRIQQGDTIATVGHSGGNTQNGLYFEIRHNGRPEDPAHWCT